MAGRRRRWPRRPPTRTGPTASASSPELHGQRGPEGRLEPELPGRRSQGTYQITLSSGEIDSGNDFGNYRNATKSGMKFEDLDADGVKDAGEPGLGGWTIEAVQDGQVVDLRRRRQPTAPTRSASTPAPTRSVRCSRPAGRSRIPAAPGTYTETSRVGRALRGNDFGNWYPGHEVRHEVRGPRRRRSSA